jgi:hypothetical protein
MAVLSTKTHGDTWDLIVDADPNGQAWAVAPINSTAELIDGSAKWQNTDGNMAWERYDVGSVVLNPVSLFLYAGNQTVAQLDALTPVKGEAYVAIGVTATPAAGSSDQLSEGDGAEFDGTSWKKAWDNVGGKPPAGIRALVAGTAIGLTLQSPLSHPADESKIAEWDNSSLTPALTSPEARQTVSVIAGVYTGGGLTYVFVPLLSDLAWINPGIPPFAASAGFQVDLVYFPAASVDGTTVETNTSNQLKIVDGSVGATQLASGQEFTSTDKSNLDNNTTHRASDGKDHSDVVLNNTHRASDGKDHSDVVLNNTHRASDGKDHSDVVLNNTHRASDGKDHSDVVLNNTHRASDGSGHADVASNTTNIQDNIVDVVVVIPDAGGGATQAQLSLDVKDLSGAALSKTCQVVLLALTSEYGITANANCSVLTPTKGVVIDADASNGRWILQTDSSGQFLANISNSTDETVWFVAISADRGVSVASQGVLVRGCVPDSGTWSA